MSRILLFALLGATASGFASDTTCPAPAVTRRDLLAADLTAPRQIDRIEIKQVTLAPHLAPGRHLHPCPVIGVITSGAIAFQIEGGPLRHLHAGDAFHEPADTRIVHFDNEGDAPASFTACYLLGAGSRELIRMLPQ